MKFLTTQVTDKIKMARSKRNSKFLKITLATLLVAAAVVGGVFAFNGGLDKKSDQASAESGTANLNPPSEAEIADGKAHEEATQDSQSNQPTQKNTANKRKVTPYITTWGRVDANTYGVNGFVQGVVESDGTCSLRLERQGKVVTRSRPAFANATNTTCGVTEVPYSSLSKGTWQATLSYSSNTSTGKSETTSIEVD